MKFQLHIITQQGSYDVTLLIQIRGSGWFITLMVWKIYHGKIEVTSVVLQHTDDLALEVTLLLCVLEDKIESKGFVSFMCPITCLHVLSSMLWCSRFPRKTMFYSTLLPIVFCRVFILYCYKRTGLSFICVINFIKNNVISDI
jgi:hypothetical protein